MYVAPFLSFVGKKCRLWNQSCDAVNPDDTINSYGTRTNERKGGCEDAVWIRLGVVIESDWWEK